MGLHVVTLCSSFSSGDLVYTLHYTLFAFAGQVVWVSGNFSGVIVYLLGVRLGDFCVKVEWTMYPGARVCQVETETDYYEVVILWLTFISTAQFFQHMYSVCIITRSNFSFESGDPSRFGRVRMVKT